MLSLVAYLHNDGYGCMIVMTATCTEAESKPALMYFAYSIIETRIIRDTVDWNKRENLNDQPENCRGDGGRDVTLKWLEATNWLTDLLHAYSHP